MRSIILAVTIFCALISSAYAKHHPMPKPTSVECGFFELCNLMQPAPQRAHSMISPTMKFTSHREGVGPRPRAWCGWFMQADTGVTSRGTGRNLNRAIEWAHIGTPASPRVGVVVVWRHHVGRIVGGSPGAWVVRSGNDSHAVRERVRSVSNAVAFRAI